MLGLWRSEIVLGLCLLAVTSTEPSQAPEQ
jgi:hypothetical protein